MARRGPKQDSKNTPAPEAEGSVATDTEAPVVEAPKEDKPIDLTAFKEAVASAVAEADDSTGVVPTANIEAVTAEYRKLEGLKAKNAAKKVVATGMKDEMDSDNLAGARAYLMLQDQALVAASGGGSKAEKVPADPTEAFVQRVATLQLGYHLATNSVPEGVTDGWQEKVTEAVNESLAQADAYRAWLHNDSEDRGDEPEVTAVVRNAVKLSEGKQARAGSGQRGASHEGPRRSIESHVVNAFADKEVGTFMKIAEIRNVRSEEYGDNPPSAGAISARLFPKSGKSSLTKLGIKPTEQDGKKGAVKVEVSE